MELSVSPPENEDAGVKFGFVDEEC